MNPHGHSSSLLRNRVRLLLSFQRWRCVLQHETRILWLGFGTTIYYYVISDGCCHSDRLTPPMLDSACDSSFIAMFTCRSLVLRIDKSWKDSAFMALGFCLHHSVGVMWAPHQLNEPFSYFWSAILVPWYSSLFAERLPFPAHIPWFFPGCSWFLFQLLHPTMWKCYIIEKSHKSSGREWVNM